jgi:hypothetical protein
LTGLLGNMASDLLLLNDNSIWLISSWPSDSRRLDAIVPSPYKFKCQCLLEMHQTFIKWINTAYNLLTRDISLNSRVCAFNSFLAQWLHTVHPFTIDRL